MNIIKTQRLGRLIFVGLMGLSLLYIALFSENIVNLGCATRLELNGGKPQKDNKKEI